MKNAELIIKDDKKEKDNSWEAWLNIKPICAFSYSESEVKSEIKIEIKKLIMELEGLLNDQA